MTRFSGSMIYLQRDPEDIYKGWGWIELKVEDIQKFSIPTEGYFAAWKRIITNDRRKLHDFESYFETVAVQRFQNNVLHCCRTKIEG